MSIWYMLPLSLAGTAMIVTAVADRVRLHIQFRKSRQQFTA